MVVEVRTLTEETKLHPLLEQLEELRKEKGLSLEKFAVQVLDISFSTYNRWLKGTFNPDLFTIEKIERDLKEKASDEDRGKGKENDDGAK